MAPASTSARSLCAVLLLTATLTTFAGAARADDPLFDPVCLATPVIGGPWPCGVVGGFEDIVWNDFVGDPHVHQSQCGFDVLPDSNDHLFDGSNSALCQLHDNLCGGPDLASCVTSAVNTLCPNGPAACAPCNAATCQAFVCSTAALPVVCVPAPPPPTPPCSGADCLLLVCGSQGCELPGVNDFPRTVVPVSMPAGAALTTTDVATPDIVTPSPSTPAETTPEVSTPSHEPVHLLGVHLPARDFGTVTIPAIDVPSATIPAQDTPVATTSPIPVGGQHVSDEKEQHLGGINSYDQDFYTPDVASVTVLHEQDIPSYPVPSQTIPAKEILPAKTVGVACDGAVGVGVSGGSILLPDTQFVHPKPIASPGSPVVENSARCQPVLA